MLLTSLEVCAGAGGQALGLELAGFEHAALVEMDKHACQTLRFNRPGWEVIEQDLRIFAQKDLRRFRGVDLFAGGVPCPPFSKAGKQLGAGDSRNLFDVAIDIVELIQPKAVMLENVRGILDPKFSEYRDHIQNRLRAAGYTSEWKLINAKDYGVPQLRPRVVLVAIKSAYWSKFSWPTASCLPAPTVGATLIDLMSEGGWVGADAWARAACAIAPTVVGGSKLHGGPDLGPTRARAAWSLLGVDGRGVANFPPAYDHSGMPRLTVKMGAKLQGFPTDWEFTGPKTHAWRQVGNAFPPPVAQAIAEKIAHALKGLPPKRKSSKVHTLFDALEAA